MATKKYHLTFTETERPWREGGEYDSLDEAKEAALTAFNKINANESEEPFLDFRKFAYYDAWVAASESKLGCMYVISKW